MFWYIGNALDFRPRGPWFESGRLQQFFFFFFSFLTFQWSYNWITDHLHSSPWRIKVRWSSPYLFLFISSLFCVSSISQYPSTPISFNFDTVIGHHNETWQETFQGHQIIVTSSRRHFVKSHYPSYLHDASAKVIHIHITYTSGQGSTGHVIKGHIKVMTRAYVRVKI